LFDDASPERLDPREYQAWKDYHRRSPLWPVRGDLQAGIVARAVFVAGHVRPLPKLEDFVIASRRPKVRKGGDAEQLKVLAALMGVPFSGQDGSR
jgi:hypothetical protein